MQGIVTPSPRKDFQPPLGIFLPSTEKQIILLEKNIILLGKIPVSYAIRTKAWYEKYQYWYKKIPSHGRKSTTLGILLIILVKLLRCITRIYAYFFDQLITRITLFFTRDTRDTWRPNTPQGICKICLIC